MLTVSEDQQITQVIHQQTQALITGDRDQLTRLIAPDAQFTHITGARQSRDDWLQQIKRGRMAYLASQEEELTVTRTGTTAQVVSRQQLTARIYGFQQTWPLESHTTLAKRHGQWLITASSAKLY
ncbi:nuclear transport factor 2 family protein [Levilactobacillus acidifarinae]|uniref:DUF4440 domain-containing protein n=1 Tax=Levilactobacillus acidifarinae DSM 19394 = JCM 15949 TaxID=1423715 RepID=A0A0R1LQV6_9LACO|nr:nuclear transport factor 2 family protein [Levilactobacillus acidifarinae]KRK96003.1 hypothetical protein FD25_GL002464 [Levilactobacillus acidifarinae DSM 19394]GEO69307.1 hypothetical protein LAC03_12170 [Levilactobacillus acidifarinae]